MKKPEVVYVLESSHLGRAWSVEGAFMFFKNAKRALDNLPGSFSGRITRAVLGRVVASRKTVKP